MEVGEDCVVDAVVYFGVVQRVGGGLVQYWCYGLLVYFVDQRAGCAVFGDCDHLWLVEVAVEYGVEHVLLVGVLLQVWVGCVVGCYGA